MRCLERLRAQVHDAGAALTAILVADGSSDGTATAVRAQYPEVRVVEGSGQLYWNGGMRLAIEVARREDPDYYLLLNDDTHLLAGALAGLLTAHRLLAAAGQAPCLVVGSTQDPETGEQSYGGWRRGGWLNPARIQMVAPGPAAQRCDTMNGNCVLVPRDVLQRVGNLDDTFTHRMGDLDYGYRAGQARCSLWVAPGYVGECVANSGKGLWVDPSLPAREQWRRALGPKGLPPREWLVFTYRHFGPVWPAAFAWPYLKIWWLALRRRLTPGAGPG